MASSQNDNGEARGRKPSKPSMPSGVRGPGGPPPAPRPGTPQSSGRRAPSPGAPTARRSALEERSFPLLRRMHAIPRWIVVVVPALLLFVGLILTGPLAWVGGILLLLVCALLGWLTALSWPVLTPGSRILRVIVVAALAGISVLKLLGRF